MENSWSERLMRGRSVMPERLFLAEMTKLRFRIVIPRPGNTWEFTHPETGALLYIVPYTERYSVALPRLRNELAAARMAEATP